MNKAGFCGILAAVLWVAAQGQLAAGPYQLQPAPGPGGLPEAFDFNDVKLRPDQTQLLENFLRQDAAKRGVHFDEKEELITGLKRASEAGPGLFISFLSTSDPAVLEIALVGLALKHGPAAAEAVPHLLRMVNNSFQDPHVAQLAVHTLGRVGAKDPSLPKALGETLAKTSAAKLELKAALVEVLGTLGIRSAPALETIWHELGSPSARVQYQVMLAMASIAPKPPPAVKPWLEKGSLASLSSTELLALVTSLPRETEDGAKAWRMFLDQAGETAPAYQRCLALKVSSQPTLRELQALELAMSAVASDDEFLAELGREALARTEPSLVEAVAPLAEGLQSPLPRVRIASATTLRRLGVKAAPAANALAQGVRSFDQRTSEAEIEALLLTIRTLGPAGSACVDSLLTLLPEQSDVYRNRQKFFLHHIRGFVFIALSEIGVPKPAFSFVIDSLANGDRNMPFAYAAAARAAGTLGREAQVAVPFLLRSLRGELRDDYLTFESLRGHRSSNGEYTTCTVEAIRALARIGSEARDAIPLLEDLVRKPPISRTNPERLQRIPDLTDEAQKALKAIRG